MYRNNRLHEVQAWGGESESLPPGEDYGFLVTEVKGDTSKKGTPQMLVVTEVLVPESHKGRKFTAYYTDRPENETCRKRMKSLTDACGIQLDQQGGFDDAALVGMRFSGDILHEQYNKEDASTGTSVSSTRAKLVNERPFGAPRDQTRQRVAQQNFQPQAAAAAPQQQYSQPTMSAPPQQGWGGPNTSAPPPQQGWGAPASAPPPQQGWGGPNTSAPPPQQQPPAGYGQPPPNYGQPPPDQGAAWGQPGPGYGPPAGQQGGPPAWGQGQVPAGYPGGGMTNGQPYAGAPYPVGSDTRPSRPNPTV